MAEVARGEEPAGLSQPRLGRHQVRVARVLHARSMGAAEVAREFARIARALLSTYRVDRWGGPDGPTAISAHTRARRSIAGVGPDASGSDA